MGSHWRGGGRGGSRGGRGEGEVGGEGDGEGGGEGKQIKEEGARKRGEGGE